MGSFFPPLQQQLPAQALAQSIGAVSAYEQLSAIREARRQQQQQALASQRKQALVEQLTGQAFSGDQQALQQLVAIDPQRAQDLGTIQTGLIERQKGDFEVGDLNRQESLAKNQRVRSIFERVRQDPENAALYRAAVGAMEGQGLIPRGVLDPERLPTEEDLAEFEQQLDLSEMMLRNPAAAQKMSGELQELAAATGGTETEEFRQGARRIFESRVGLREASTLKLLREGADKAGDVEQPAPGLIPLPNRSPSKNEVKEARRIVSGIAPVISSINNLEQFVNSVGFEAVRTDKAAEAQTLASFVQLQLKDALELGALDAGSERFLRNLIPNDPTQLRQGVVRRSLQRMRSELRNRMNLQARARGFNVDIDQVMGRGGPVSAAGLSARQEQQLQSQLQQQGYQPRQIDDALANLKAITSGGREAEQRRAISTEQASSYIDRRLSEGVDRRQIIRELQQMNQAGGSADSPQRRGEEAVPAQLPSSSPLTIPGIRQRVSELPFVRQVLDNPSLLPKDRRREVIRDAIEGDGIVEAIDRAMKGL